MQDSRKALASTGIVLALFFLINSLLLAISSPYAHNYDWYLREDLSGSLDFLIVGASHGQCALYTREIDRITGSNSYNLCYDSEKNFEKEYLLSKELSRNNIKTVVIELSYDTLQSSRRTDYADANVFSIMRMDSFSDRIQYFSRNVKFDNKLYVYAGVMCHRLLGMLQQKHIEEEQIDLKGSRFISGKDYCLLPEEVVDAYNKNEFSVSSFKEDTVNGFTDLIDLCQEHGAKVIVAVVPVSDNFLWHMDNLDEFSAWAKEYCAENHVEYYDFNLLKDRYILFSDKDCYSTDTHHMSEKGSRVFSGIFANTIQKASDGQDVSDYFYSSFDEMKQDSPYMSTYRIKCSL